MFELMRKARDGLCGLRLVGLVGLDVEGRMVGG